MCNISCKKLREKIIKILLKSHCKNKIILNIKFIILITSYLQNKKNYKFITDFLKNTIKPSK
jgi:hypothetical protein